jgi:hypothetical protein
MGSACRYESIGKLDLPQVEWKRLAKLMAASLQEAGVGNPIILGTRIKRVLTSSLSERQAL